MIRPKRIGHVVLKVNDLALAEKLYVEVLGFEVVNRLDSPKAVFLSLGVQHHDLALIQVDADAASPRNDQVGLHHFALQVEDASALQDSYDTLRRYAVVIHRAVDHGTTHSIYFDDPAGNRVELYCDIGENGLARARHRTVRSLEEFSRLDLG